MPYGTVNADVIGTSVANTSLGAGNASIMKNRIINGAMRIDQRNAGASITLNTTGLYPVDRFRTGSNGTWTSAVFSGQQNRGSVTLPAGYVNYVGIATTTADATPAAGTSYDFLQWIEGYNIADLGWGTANAKTVTLSFQVYSNLTGTFGGNIQNGAANRSYPFSYSIPVANTWTQISVTIAGDTTGTWQTTNGSGIRVNFSLGAGSTYLGTAGIWGSSPYTGVTGQQQICASTSNYLYITGVQLEVGTSATGFEYRMYQQELALCQRYYETGSFYSGGAAGAGIGVGSWASFNTAKRATPTMTLSPFSYTNASGANATNTTTQGTGLFGVQTAAGPYIIYINWTAAIEL